MRSLIENNYLGTCLILFCAIPLLGCGHGTDNAQQKGETNTFPEVAEAEPSDSSADNTQQKGEADTFLSLYCGTFGRQYPRTEEDILTLDKETASTGFGPSWVDRIAVNRDGDIFVLCGDEVWIFDAGGTHLNEIINSEYGPGLGYTGGNYRYTADPSYIQHVQKCTRCVAGYLEFSAHSQDSDSSDPYMRRQLIANVWLHQSDFEWINISKGTDSSYIYRVPISDYFSRGVFDVVFGAADSVYVLENWRSLSVYDPRNPASLIRYVGLAEDISKEISLIGAIADGWYVKSGLPGILDPKDGSMTVNNDRYWELIKINKDGSYSTDPLGKILRAERIYHVHPKGFGYAWVDVPFGRSDIYGVGYDDLLYYGWNDKIEIAIVSSDGSMRDTIRYEHTPVPITSAEMSKISDWDNEFFKRLMESREIHEAKPAFQTFVVDDMSRVWVRLSSLQGATEAEWLILNRESQAVGHITLPVTVDLEVIRDGYAYGVQYGARDTVVIYEIHNDLSIQLKKVLIW